MGGDGVGFIRVVFLSFGCAWWAQHNILILTFILKFQPYPYSFSTPSYVFGCSSDVICSDAASLPGLPQLSRFWMDLVTLLLLRTKKLVITRNLIHIVSRPDNARVQYKQSS